MIVGSAKLGCMPIVYDAKQTGAIYWDSGWGYLEVPLDRVSRE